jgi:DNA-binding NarL/FixJ family response regulator
MKKITVLIVDDHMVVREGLRALLASEPDIEVIGEAEDGRSAVQFAKRNPPDVVVMDVAMPLLNGFEATRQILKNCPGAGVLVLSSHNDEECVEQLLKAGAAGYIIKQCASSDLSTGIREVRRGNTFLSPSIARHIRDREKMLSESYGRKKSLELTSREAEVLRLVAGGFSNREAADELGISIKTIEKHRQQVMNKLNIHEVAGLTRYAISRKGLEPLNVRRDMPVDSTVCLSPTRAAEGEPRPLATPLTATSRAKSVRVPELT